MHRPTRDTYNRSAGSLSQHYDEIGPREGDIDLAFALAGSPENAVVLEIGCGNGRDARAILRHTPYYTGIDSSEQMIELAQQKAPNGTFVLSDAASFEYPDIYDIVFAFASLRHMDIEELVTVLRKVHDSLRSGGVLYISSNYGETYRVAQRKDKYGKRDIYYYNPDIIQKHAPVGLKRVQEIHDTIDNEPWFELVLKKQ